MTTKSDLINSVYSKLGYLPKEDVALAVDKVINCLKEELGDGNRVELRGFGSFSIRKRKYAGKEKFYNTIYYRMSRVVQKKLNKQNYNEPNLY